MFYTDQSDTFLDLPHLPDGVKSAHLTARESVNIDDLINCDFFMMLSAGVSHLETQADGYIYIVTLLSWLKSNCLLDCPAVPPPCSPLHMAHMKVSSPWPCMFVIMYIKHHHTTHLQHLTSYPLLCICYFIIQLILYNVVRRRNFTQV